MLGITHQVASAPMPSLRVCSVSDSAELAVQADQLPEFCFLPSRSRQRRDRAGPIVAVSLLSHSHHCHHLCTCHLSLVVAAHLAAQPLTPHSVRQWLQAPAQSADILSPAKSAPIMTMSDIQPRATAAETETSVVEEWSEAFGNLDLDNDTPDTTTLHSQASPSNTDPTVSSDKLNIVLPLWFLRTDEQTATAQFAQDNKTRSRELLNFRVDRSAPPTNNAHHTALGSHSTQLLLLLWYRLDCW